MSIRVATRREGRRSGGIPPTATTPEYATCREERSMRARLELPQPPNRQHVEKNAQPATARDCHSSQFDDEAHSRWISSGRGLDNGARSSSASSGHEATPGALGRRGSRRGVRRRTEGCWEATGRATGRATGSSLRPRRPRRPSRSGSRPRQSRGRRASWSHRPRCPFPCQRRTRFRRPCRCWGWRRW